MINHNRTLLLNLDGSTFVPPYLGEEIIDPDFRSTVLPAVLKKVDTAIFGDNPSREMRNRIAWDCLLLMYAMDLEPELDDRITYDLRKSPFYDHQSFVPTVSRLGSTTADAYILNPLEVATSDKFTSLQWDVNVVAGPDLRVRDIRNGSVTTTTGLGSSGGKFVPITLPGSNFQFVGATASSQRWFIACSAYPMRKLSDLSSRLRGLPTYVIADVFQLTSQLRYDNSFASTYVLWQQDKLELRAVAAFLAAYVYRLDLARINRV